MVPALMLVPGPHLLNGLFDIYENHIQTGICRLILAVGILIAATAGTLAGAWAVMGLRNLSGATSDDVQLTLWLDVALAALAACGFGAFYNAPWKVLWISMVFGIVGHGVRFLCIGGGASLASSTLLACSAIGLLAGIVVFHLRLPFSNVAFAAAVPMMPGTLLYRSFAGAVQLCWAGSTAMPTQTTAAMVLLLQACMVVGAMAAGLLFGSFVAALVRAGTRELRTLITARPV